MGSERNSAGRRTFNQSVDKLGAGEPECLARSGMNQTRLARLIRGSWIWLPLIEPERKPHRLKAGKARV